MRRASNKWDGLPRVAMIAVAGIVPLLAGGSAAAGPLREEVAAVRRLAEAGTLEVPPAAEESSAKESRAERVGEEGRAGEPAADAGRGDALVERLDAIFDAALADEEIGGDTLARAYLDAADLLVARGRLDDATRYFREADLWSSRAEARAVARFNYAQVRYRQAIEAMTRPGGAGSASGAGLNMGLPGRQGGGQSAAPDLELVKGRLRDSASAFRAVLDVDPGDAEAARHVERVRRMIHAIDEMVERAKEAAQKKREQADKLDELADRQQQESIQNQQQSQSGENAQQDQKQIGDETAEQARQMDESGDRSEGNSSARQKLEEAMEQQRRAQEEIAQGDPSEASAAQLEAAKKMREAAQALRQEAGEQSQGQQGEGEQDGEPQQQPGEPQDGEQDGEQEGESEQDRITDWLLDREERTREQRDRQLRAIRRGQSAPVERDW